MLIDETKNILDEYAQWISDMMHAIPSGDGVKIAGPMLNRNNDFMTVYMEKTPTGDYVVTDLGETIEDLEFSGCTILKSQGRLDKLSTVLRSYGVERKADEILVKASRSDLVLKMNMLFQAMASVDDLFFTTTETVRDLFEEESGAGFSRTISGRSKVHLSRENPGSCKSLISPSPKRVGNQNDSSRLLGTRTSPT